VKYDLQRYQIMGKLYERQLTDLRKSNHMLHNSTNHGLSSSNWGRLLAPGVAKKI